MFKSFMKEVDKVGKQLSKEADYVTKKVNNAVDQNRSSSQLDLFQTGNVIQLVSRSSSKTIQIVMSPAGYLVVDGNGPLDPQAFHCSWTVVNMGNNQVRLMNNNNYLAIINGATTIVAVPAGSQPGPETVFQLSQNLGVPYISLESLLTRDQHVGVLTTGQLKPAVATRKEIDSHFGVKLISTAYPVGLAPVASATPPGACNPPPYPK